MQALADDIFDRVEWTWLSEDTSLLPHGWTPEVGFLPYRWDNYSELMMMYLLGLGSTNYPLRDDTWTAWKRLKFEYDGSTLYRLIRTIICASVFAGVV